MLPKGSKHRTRIGNWHPITLLDCLYKILSKVIAEKIASVLLSIIHEDQCGFVPGHYIREAVRNAMDVMDWLKKNNKEGLLLLIDLKCSES